MPPKTRNPSANNPKQKNSCYLRLDSDEGELLDELFERPHTNVQSIKKTLKKTITISHLFLFLKQYEYQNDSNHISFFEFVTGLSADQFKLERKNVLGRTLTHQAVIKGDKGV